MAKKRKKKKAKPKIEQVKTEPELSETPVIKDGQATAPIPKATIDVTIMPGAESQAEPVPETDESKPDLPSPRMPRSINDIPVTKRPKVEPEPEPIEPTTPAICAGCKATIESGTMRHCPRCNLYFCPTCAGPGSCHKCGKALK